MRIKTLFSGWKEVTEETAREWAKFKYSHSPMREEEKREYFSHWIEGANIDKLLERK